MKSPGTGETYTNKVCVVCGKKFLTASRAQTCSKECRYSMHVKVCVDCGVEFRTGTAVTERCSGCRRARHAELSAMRQRANGKVDPSLEYKPVGPQPSKGVKRSRYISVLGSCESCNHNQMCKDLIKVIGFALPCEKGANTMSETDDNLKRYIGRRDKMWKRGTQIAKVPPYANGDVKHPDVEYGFVTQAVDEDNVYCRYFAWDGHLRTVANSELTPVMYLVPHVSRDQTVIDNLLLEMGYVAQE